MDKTRRNIRFREAVRLAKERAAGHIHNMELDSYFGDDVLNEFSDESSWVLEKAQHHVGRLIEQLAKARR